MTALTARQIEVLDAYERLGTMPAVAAHLGIAESTVNNHLYQVRRKLNVRWTVEAIWALKSRRIKSP